MGTLRPGGSYQVGLPSLSHVPPDTNPDLIQEVNVQSPVAVILVCFFFSFLDHWVLSFHCHATHSSPFLPAISPGPGHFSCNSLSSLPPPSGWAARVPQWVPMPSLGCTCRE